jgi:hypothetical protein
MPEQLDQLKPNIITCYAAQGEGQYCAKILGDFLRLIKLL